MKNITLLQAPVSHKLLGHNDLKRSLLKKLAHVIINGGTPEEYREAYLEIPAFNKKLRQTFVERVLRKARQENWLVSQIEEVMIRLNQM